MIVMPSLVLNRADRGNIAHKLEADQLCDELFECPCCQSSCLTRALELQSDPDVWFLACGRCGCGFANRMPTSAFLAEYYARYYAGDSVQHHISEGRLARHILRTVRINSRHLRILDFGGGDGAVACAIVRELQGSRSITADVIVVDYNQLLLKNPPPDTTITHRGELADVGPCDLVVASAVLEHVPGLRPCLLDLLDRLAAGGYLYARTPYVLPIARALRRVGIDFHTMYPAHLYDLGPGFWDGCLKVLGKERDCTLLSSRTSLNEASWSKTLFRAMATSVLKSPNTLLGVRHPFLGGWEVIIRRNPSLLSG